MRSSYVLAASAALATGLHVESRDGQTSAICSASFIWMENSKGYSPCQVAASVGALCNFGQWLIGALNESVTYTNPTGPTANLCTCSWANYNLLSACVACQGFGEQTPSWTVFKANCTTEELSDIFFPEQLILPSDVAIPNWAQQDPMQWTNEKFSASQAQTIADKNLPDFVGGVSTSTAIIKTPTVVKKKTNIGAIIGGIIGGLIIIRFILGWMLAVLVLWIKRGQRRPPAMGTSNLESTNAHTLLSVKTAHPPTRPPILRQGTSLRSVSIRSWYEEPPTGASQSALHHTSPVPTNSSYYETRLST